MADMELDGIDSLIRKLEDMGKAGTRVQNKALKKAGEIINNQAKSELEKSKIHTKNNKTFMDNNIRTGKLQKCLKVSGVRKKRGKKFVLVGIQRSDNSEIFYGKFLEFGSSHQATQPFMGPAYESKKDEATQVIKTEIKNALGL